MIDTSYKLGKKQRLCSKKDIEKLFEEGERFFSFPIKAFVLREQEKGQVMVIAPKRNHKHAVDRNRIKRLLREVFRLRGQEILEQNMHIALLYTGRKLPKKETLEKSFEKILEEIQQ